MQQRQYKPAHPEEVFKHYAMQGMRLKLKVFSAKFFKNTEPTAWVLFALTYDVLVSDFSALGVLRVQLHDLGQGEGRGSSEGRGVLGRRGRGRGGGRQEEVAVQSLHLVPKE